MVLSFLFVSKNTCINSFKCKKRLQVDNARVKYLEYPLKEY